MKQSDYLSAFVSEDLSGKRLDQALAELFPDFSRSRLQQWIKNGNVKVNDVVLRPRDKVHAGDCIALTVLLEAEVVSLPEAIALDVVYEDEQIIVVNKPQGMVVHPAAGNRQGTLLNALLYYAPELESVPRAGIVHRLDKDTTGLLVIARTLQAQNHLVTQLQARAFQREYQTLVVGVMAAGGTVDAPIGRHPVNRKRMAVVSSGKPAITHYRVEERFRAHSRLNVRLETGRTHQIRVHMAHIRYPVLGDPVYGGRLRLPAGCSDALRSALTGFNRQALHAARLGISHPATGEHLQWEVPLPSDMRQLIELLREDNRSH